jgi:CO/xanthine dehydrogenase Mo-binding subunit
MAFELLGKNFTPPDVHAKVTGKAKYSEDIRVDGMVFVKLLTSPMPHARVTSVDDSAALAMPGVHGILRASEVSNPPDPQETILTDEPLFVGHPILAVAADTEELASDALEQIKVTYEELPFTVDPLQSLYPGGPNARTNGNAMQGPEIRSVKWTAQDFAAVEEGQLPLGAPLAEWSFGDLDAGFAKAKVVLDETFVTAGLGHHSMEPRSALAYWQNGKCYLYGSTQSQSFPIPGIARSVGVEPADLVYVSEFCGGGFGSKGGAYPLMAIPALMSKKIGRPVMMRVSRHEEYFMGSARPGFQGRIKMGFAADGRVTAADLYIVQENGPNQGFNDWTSAAEAVSLVYQPPAMRFRGVPVMTNTPPRGPQRGPGQNQIAAAVEPLIDKAAKQLGIDRVAIRRINAPDNSAKIGSMQGGVTSAYLKDALDRGAQMFDWAGRQARSAQAATGSKVRGLGVGTAYHSAGGNGFDGLVVITPEGKTHIHTGVGNLGTYSHTATSRVAAEILKANWDNCVVVRGDSSKHLPWNLGQFGSNTSFTMTRTNYVAAMDAVAKLKEIAAMDLGGAPEDYDIGGERVFAKTDSSKGLTYAQAAQRAIELGGKFDGHEVANDLNVMTKASAAGLAGTGLIGVAKDNLPRVGTVPALAAGFIEIELDTETGKFEILDYVGVADCGTVLHPQGLSHQIKSGAVMGLGLAASERHIYDPQNGLPGNIGLLQAKPVSYLDVPATMQTAWIDIADAQNPVGAKGVGEPVQGCAAAALLCAISDALGGHYFNRTPVMADMIVNAAAKRPQSHKPLQVNTA